MSFIQYSIAVVLLFAVAAYAENANYTLVYIGGTGKPTKEDLNGVNPRLPLFHLHQHAKVPGSLTVSAVAEGKRLNNVGSRKDEPNLAGLRIVQLTLPSNLSLVEAISLTLTPPNDPKVEKRTLNVGGFLVVGLKPKFQIAGFNRPENTTVELLPNKELIYQRVQPNKTESAFSGSSILRTLHKLVPVLPTMIGGEKHDF